MSTQQLSTIESLPTGSLFTWQGDAPQPWFRKSGAGFTNIETKQRFSFKTHPAEKKREVVVIIRTRK
jgi:hypothetical protein